MLNTFTPRTSQSKKLTKVKISRLRNAEEKRQHYVKGEQKWFHLNGHTVGFLPHTQNELELRTKQIERFSYDLEKRFR